MNITITDAAQSWASHRQGSNKRGMQLERELVCSTLLTSMAGTCIRIVYAYPLKRRRKLYSNLCIGFKKPFELIWKFAKDATR